MAWEVEFTDEFEAWWLTLTVAEQARINRAVEMLIARGLGLGRPWADTARASRYSNMKELRPRGGHLRIFFAFDPRRAAVLLIGGNKAGRWTEFYAEMILVADALYAAHLETLREEEDHGEGI